MSDNPGMPEYDEPSAAELDRVRALLAGLGEEPAPPAVVARLERVLDSQLPAVGAVPRRRPRRWLRRLAVGVAPVAASGAGALVVSQAGNENPAAKRTAASSVESLSQAAAPAPLAATDSAAGAAESAGPPSVAQDQAGALSVEAAPATKASKTTTTPATPEELRQAALDAYRETRRLLLDRRKP
jgi:hypothetical protein